MKRQEAIKALLVADKGDEAEKVISEVVGRANDAYRSVREDPELSDEGKRIRLKQHYEDADRVITERLVKLAKEVTRWDRDDAERVFGTKGLSGDPAALAISRRDAADRVAKVTKREELRELLARATRSGDEVLARAVVEKAMRDRDADTVNQFIADRPALEDATERLWKAETAATGTLRVNMGLLGLKPNELKW